MSAIYVTCAAVGGALLLCQLAMTLLGMGDHALGGDALHFDHGGPEAADASQHGDAAWFFGLLTLRTIVAALTFFGLIGWASSAGGMSALLSLPVALIAGFLVMLFVATVMRKLSRMGDDGTVHIEKALGANGTVYLNIPANKSGVGKVTLSLQNRTAEVQAVTLEDEIKTGTKVVVVDVIGHDTVQVIRAPEIGAATHV